MHRNQRKFKTFDGLHGTNTLLFCNGAAHRPRACRFPRALIISAKCPSEARLHSSLCHLAHCHNCGHHGGRTCLFAAIEAASAERSQKRGAHLVRRLTKVGQEEE